MKYPTVEADQDYVNESRSLVDSEAENSRCRFKFGMDMFDFYLYPSEDIKYLPIRPYRYLKYVHMIAVVQEIEPEKNINYFIP